MRLIEESLRLGHENHWCDVRSIRHEGGRVRLTSQAVLEIGSGRAASAIRRGPARAREPGDFTSLQYRVDPPVDLAYLQPVQLLALGMRGTRAELVNPPEILTLGNEKLEASLIPRALPPTCVSADLPTLAAFGRKLGQTILKPLHEAQSKGVELLDWRTPEGISRAERLIREQSRDFIQPVVLQKYLPGILKGECRLWFLDGRLLASAIKLPAHGTYRIDMDRGGHLTTRPLKARESAIARAVGKHLRQRRIRLAAVDLIDGYVTDFNFTSPGLLFHMEELLQKNLAAEVIRALANPLRSGAD